MDSSIGGFSPRSNASSQYMRRSGGGTGGKASRHHHHHEEGMGSPRHGGASGNHNVDLSLTHFDLSAIEAMDPSLQGGWRVIYDRECPFELRYQETEDSPQEVGTLEAIKVKLMLIGTENGPEALKIELSSENDLFFHYVHTVDEVGFRIMQEQQKLMIEFENYNKVLIRMLNSCIKEPNTHLAIFVLQEDGNARLDFIKNMEYKFVELLTCKFTKSNEELVRQHIAYRYNAMKSRLALMQARLADINALVKVKNPSLLLQIRKPQRK